MTKFVGPSAYVVLITALVGGMFWARGCALKNYGTDTAQEDWEAWRTAVAETQQDARAVKRAVPDSPQPPALVLMRDYFAICVLFAVGLTSVLFVTLFVMIRGAVRQSPADPPNT